MSDKLCFDLVLSLLPSHQLFETLSGPLISSLWMKLWLSYCAFATLLYCATRIMVHVWEISWFNLAHLIQPPPSHWIFEKLPGHSSFPSEVCTWDINWFCYHVVPQHSFCVTNCVLIQPSSTPSSPLTVCDIVWPFDLPTLKFGVDIVFLCLLHNAEIIEVARSCVLLNSFLFPSPSH